MSYYQQIVSLLDDNLAQGAEFNDALCLVKIGGYTIEPDFNNIKLSGKAVDTLKLWPALKFPTFSHLIKQIPRNTDLNINGHILCKYRKLNTGDTNFGIAYLFGKGDLILLPKNDDEVVFDFNYHKDEMLSAEGFCSTNDFQYAYQKVIERLNIVVGGDAPTEDAPTEVAPAVEDDAPADRYGISRLVNFVRPIWKSTSPGGSNDGVERSLYGSNDGVERSLYPDSSGPMGTPPELKVVRAGRKRKGGTRNKKRSKKTATNNNNCRGGARIVDTPLGNGEEQRECLKRALLNLLALEEMKRVRNLSLPFPSSPDGGDVTIKQGNTWLMEHGLILNPVTDRYKKKGGILYHLLQPLQCRLVIKAELTMRDGSGVANHFFAYDGTTFHDVPHSIKPSRDDRSKKENCLSIFQKLFPKEQFSEFQVTNVFELCVQ